MKNNLYDFLTELITDLDDIRMNVVDRNFEYVNLKLQKMIIQNKALQKSLCPYCSGLLLGQNHIACGAVASVHALPGVKPETLAALEEVAKNLLNSESCDCESCNSALLPHES